ncbi:YdcH family protein [Qipengyuania sp. JC766]|uniref:YdcH family protein n=1 Tax=Qipengyuania sp. JC766 TaxID=3232139 RepID=UPI00345747C8
MADTTKPSGNDTTIPYLRKLVREHRALNRLIDTTKAAGAREDLKSLKRLRLRLKDQIATLRREPRGRGMAN